MRLEFLGTGTSHGVPMIGCHCPTCISTDPRDNRYRSSVLVTSEGPLGTRLVVDCPPEFRLQALRAGLDGLDAVLLTHSHADHLFGMDDLRRFNQMRRESIPVFGSPDTLFDVERVFKYAFTPTQWGGGKPQLSLIPLAPGVSRSIGDLLVTPITINHGELGIYGYRISETDETGAIKCSLAYLTDCSGIPRSSMDLLTDLDLLVLGALRHKPHPTHFTIGQAIETASAMGAVRTRFTHLAHDLSHSEEDALLPSGMGLAYDGLVISIPMDPQGSLDS